MPPKRVTPEKITGKGELTRGIRKKVLSSSSSRTLPVKSAIAAGHATKPHPKKEKAPEAFKDPDSRRHHDAAWFAARDTMVDRHHHMGEHAPPAYVGVAFSAQDKVLGSHSGRVEKLFHKKKKGE